MPTVPPEDEGGPESRQGDFGGEPAHSDPSTGEHDVEQESSDSDDPESASSRGDDTDPDNQADDDPPASPSRDQAALDLSGILNLPDFSKFAVPGLPDLVVSLPKFDFPVIAVPLPDFSGLLPTIDIATLFPRIDLALPIVEWAAVLPKIELPNFGPALGSLLEELRRSLPPNWPSGVDTEALMAIIQDEGLPLVWVPREQVIAELLAAPDRSARVEILVFHRDDLIDDCRQVLAAVHTKTLGGQLPLAMRSVDALEAGHYEAAQALAVVVTETAVARAISDKYEEVKRQVLFDPELVPYTQLRLRAALAPIGSFYTSWHVGSALPPPEALSRHVTVHQADHGHYTEGNAVVAILLAASVLRALQELQDLAEASDVDE